MTQAISVMLVMPQQRRKRRPRTQTRREKPPEKRSDRRTETPHASVATPTLSPVLLPVGDDGEAVRVVPVAAHIRVPAGHTC